MFKKLLNEGQEVIKKVMKSSHNELTMEEALILIEKRREYDKSKKGGKKK